VLCVCVYSILIYRYTCTSPPYLYTIYYLRSFLSFHPFATVYGRRQYQTLVAHDDVANFYRKAPRLNVWQQHVWTGVRANRHFGRKYNILFCFPFVLFSPPVTRNNVHGRLSLARAYSIFFIIIIVFYIYVCVCVNPLKHTLYVL